MTKAEREELNTSDWTDEGQVQWCLQQRAGRDDLAPVSEIASMLKSQPASVVPILRTLATRWLAASENVDRRELWGTFEQVQRLRDSRDRATREAESSMATRRQHILDTNDRLAELKTLLEDAMEGQPIAVVAQTRSWGSDELYPATLIISTDDPGAASWLLGRLRHPAPDEGRPTDEEWSALWDRLEELLSPLAWAGWKEDEDDAFSDYDREGGPALYTVMNRTGMALQIEYQPASGSLRFQPRDDFCDDGIDIFSMLEEEIIIRLGDDPDEAVDVVADRAAELGLLDATRITIAEDSGVESGAFMAAQYAEWILRPAADERGLTMTELTSELTENELFSTFIDVMASFLAPSVLPDVVPDAAVLGIAAWCWRNDTAVEDWHLASDVLMARVNIAVTEAIRPHVEPYEGVDWESIKTGLTDPGWSLPDGRKIAELFGEGWPDVRETVLARLNAWQGLDEHLGARATLRLLTVAGSTSYTDRWWGQPRWRAMCQAVINDAVNAGVALPSPYDTRGALALVADLEHPSQLSDDVLDWMIDMPAGDVEGPRGLRAIHQSGPPVRVIRPWPREYES